MAPQDDTLTKKLPLPAFERPKWLVEPAVRSYRLFAPRSISSFTTCRRYVPRWP